MSDTGSIVNTPLWNDVLSICEGKDLKRNVHISATFHSEKEDFPVLKVLMHENHRDYYKLTGEYGVLTSFMAMGDYVYRLLPFRDNLEVTIKVVFKTDTGDDPKDSPVVETRYKALIDLKLNPFPSSESLSNKTLKDLNILPPVTVKVELQDRSEELLRLITISGSYKNVTMEQMLRGIFIHETNKIKVNGKPIVEVLEVDTPDNKVPVANLLLPQTSNIYLRDLPGYLQQKSKGVYSSGIGSFFQRYKNKATWFVYPLYDVNRFNSDKTKLVIYGVPEDKLPAMDRTFRQEGKIIYIVATGEKKMVDNSKNPDLNSGTGFRMADAEAFMLKPVVITEDGFTANRRRLSSEVSNSSRKDQTNSAPSFAGSANSFLRYSEVLGRACAGLALIWNNSNPDLLYPGMPVKYVYMDKGEYVESKGTLVTAFTITKIVGNPIEGTSHAITSQLNIFLEPRSGQPDNTKSFGVGESL